MSLAMRGHTARTDIYFFQQVAVARSQVTTMFLPIMFSRPKPNFSIFLKIEGDLP